MNLLLAEDEKDLSRALVAVLEHSGYTVTPVYDGEAAVEAAKSSAFDCMIFDIMMPKMDGITALGIIRSSGDTTPVLLLTAKAEVDDRVNGLDAGADDYLTKPFAMKELLARVRSMTRRRNEYSGNELTFGDLTLNAGQLELVSANSVRLSGKECDLMQLLILNAGRELHTDYLLEQVWENEQDAQSDTVWLYISYLRNKLRAVDSGARIVGEKGESFIIISSEDRSAD